MIDINIYRSKIGQFSPRINKKSVFKNQYFIPFWWNSNHSGKKTLSLLQSFCKLVMILVLAYPSSDGSSHPRVSGHPPSYGDQGQAVQGFLGYCGSGVQGQGVQGSNSFCGRRLHGVQVGDLPGSDNEGAVDPRQLFCRQANHFVSTGVRGHCEVHNVQDQVAHGKGVVGGIAVGYCDLYAVKGQLAEGLVAHCWVARGQAHEVQFQVVVHTERLKETAILYWGNTGRDHEVQQYEKVEGLDADCLGAREGAHGVHGQIQGGALHCWGATSRAPVVLYCKRTDMCAAACSSAKGRVQGSQGQVQGRALAAQGHSSGQTDHYAVGGLDHDGGRVQGSQGQVQGRALAAQGQSSGQVDHYAVGGLEHDGELADNTQAVLDHYPCGLCKKPAKTSENHSEIEITVNWNSTHLFHDINSLVDSEIVDHNFRARYLNGNIQKSKGILNMHLNIRSLRHKVYEIKQIVKESKPTLIGLSECELSKDTIDEKSLKVPGYRILYPKSWDRVVVYIRENLKYQQLLELEDETV